MAEIPVKIKNKSQNGYPTDGVSVSVDLKIFWCNTNVNPGEDISIQGSFSSSAIVGLVINESSEYLPIPRISSGENYIKAYIPDFFALGMYRVFVIDKGFRSEFFYVNRAIGDAMNTNSAYVGATISVKGRNLLFPNTTPTIRLVSQSNGASFNATYVSTGSHIHKIKFTPPVGLTLGVTYDAYISNGFGGSLGETKINGSLLCIAAASDPFEIEAAWHATFTNTLIANEWNGKTDVRITSGNALSGDGTTNDLAKLNAITNQISGSGGGVLLLPTGVYLLQGSGFVGLYVPENVVIKGASKTGSIIRFGTGLTSNKVLGGGNNCGFYNLTIDNTNTNTGYAIGLFGGNNIFFSNVICNMQKYDWLEFNECNSVAIVKSQFSQLRSGTLQGNVGMNNCDFATYKENVFTTPTQSIYNYGCSAIFADKNIFNRDAGVALNENDTVHVVVSEFTKDSLYENNIFYLVNGPIPRGNRPGYNGTRNNDGESFISECGAGLEPDYDYGTVSAASYNTLTDESKSWSSAFEYNPSVAIIKGKGVGQVRKIFSRTGTVLTLEIGWDIVPDSTSNYSIFNFGLSNVAIVNNYFSNQQRGITLYHNPMAGVDISGNSFLNSGSIDITPIQIIKGSKKTFTPIYNISIRKNTVNGIDDPYNGVSIGVQAIQHLENLSIGTICTNLQIIANNLIASSPNKDVIQDELFPTGYNAFLRYHPGTSIANEDVPIILGTIINNNRAENISGVVNLNGGSYYTSVKRTMMTNCPSLIDESEYDSLSHNSVQTITE